MASCRSLWLPHLAVCCGLQVPRNSQPSHTTHVAGTAGASGIHERAILEAFRQGMLLNPLAADGMLAAIQDLEGRLGWGALGKGAEEGERRGACCAVCI